MAEFKVIMSGWKDICKRHVGCIDCPVKACDGWGDILMGLDEKTIKSIETDVLAETPVWIYCGPHPLGLNFNCSVCGFKSEVQYKHCPDCGRKMLIK
ncbi:MAG: hypothetical protein MJZ85_11045 [Bacteroidales bacterium]|nr:hypothetical protein [Bacteroidales bacterium]